MPTTEPYSLRNKRIWVAGHRGLVGSALIRRLKRAECEIITATRERLDLRVPAALDHWLRDTRPHAIFLAAARVGGIHANATRPADFIYDNLMIEANVVAAAQKYGVEKLMLLGSSCIYPRLAPQPMPEDALLTGPLEPTNQWYAIAKIAGIMLGQAFRRQHGSDVVAVMPTNLYGPNDNFDLLQSHVVPALIAKAHAAKLARAPTLEVWGTGQAVREFLHVDDAADAMLFLMERYSDEAIVNIGTGEGISVGDLARLVCSVVGFTGDIAYDRDKPDGTPRKIVDVGRLHALGWRHRIGLEAGIDATYRWYVDHLAANGRTRLAHA